ncbi:GNAT family N-acetyltransferase [Shewanella olleyana]|uniref:GNAT family N-acetyltransferase n=1 Tax=Shewanella olleyana TaxID=135626 RepID=UPI00200E6CB7|nr:GNAT family N-acetyltransferase [Shewanella olleyana]MCL1065592.1 GNAT family N-acetyltransferase [Shewanella olleyana]
MTAPLSSTLANFRLFIAGEKQLNLKFRKATSQDIDLLKGLEQQVVQAERPFNSSIKSENAYYYDLESLLTDDQSYILVGEIEGRIIATGYVQIRSSKRSLNHDKHGYLGFMYVAPEHRGHGINQLLIDKLVQWSKQRLVNDFYLDVYDDNEAAIRAYKKLGFSKTLVEMKLNL